VHHQQRTVLGRPGQLHRAQPANLHQRRRPAIRTRPGGLLQDLKSLGQVKVPVLIVCGRDDAVTPSFACPVLKRRYTGSSDVSLSFLAKTGHAFTLERTAPTFRRRVGRWLGAHGF